MAAYMSTYAPGAIIQADKVYLDSKPGIASDSLTFPIFDLPFERNAERNTTTLSKSLSPILSQIRTQPYMKQNSTDASNNNFRNSTPKTQPVELQNSEYPLVFNNKNPLKYASRRSEAVSKIFQSLHVEAAYPVKKAITGYGGMGKSQLAKLYIEKNKHLYQVVWWFDAKNISNIPEQYKLLAKKMNEKIGSNIDINDLSLSEMIEKVQEQLENIESYLLIFDGRDQFSNELEEKYIPGFAKKNLHAHVIVTTRDAHYPYKIDFRGSPTNLPNPSLPPLSLNESIELLKKVITDNGAQQDTYKELANCLKNYPIALTQAACYINKYHANIEDYIKDYRENRNIVEDNIDQLKKDNQDSLYPNDSEYLLTARSVFNIAMKKIKSELKDDQFLRFLAYINGTSISRKYMHKIINDDGIVNSTIDVLMGHGFIEPLVLNSDDNHYFMHDIVQESIRKSINRNSIISILNDLLSKNVEICNSYDDFSVIPLLGVMIHVTEIILNLYRYIETHPSESNSISLTSLNEILMRERFKLEYSGYWDIYKTSSDILLKKNPFTLENPNDYGVLVLSGLFYIYSRERENRKKAESITKAACRYINECRPESITMQHKKYYVEALCNLSGIARDNKDYIESKYYIESALKYINAESITDKQAVLRCKYNKSAIELNLLKENKCNVEQAKQSTSDLLEYAKEVQDVEHEIRAEINMADIMYSIDQYDKANDIISKIIEGKITILRTKMIYCLNYAKIKEKVNETESACNYAERTKEIAMKLKIEEFIKKADELIQLINQKKSPTESPSKVKI